MILTPFLIRIKVSLVPDVQVVKLDTWYEMKVSFCREIQESVEIGVSGSQRESGESAGVF